MSLLACSFPHSLQIILKAPVASTGLMPCTTLGTMAAVASDGWIHLDTFGLWLLE